MPQPSSPAAAASRADPLPATFGAPTGMRSGDGTFDSPRLAVTQPPDRADEGDGTFRYVVVIMGICLGLGALVGGIQGFSEDWPLWKNIAGGTFAGFGVGFCALATRMVGAFGPEG